MMLDFTVKPTDLRKARFARRAQAARHSARVFRVVLAGLVGAALILDPSLAVALRGAFGDVMGIVQNTVQMAAGDGPALATAAPVSAQPLDAVVLKAAFVRP